MRKALAAFCIALGLSSGALAWTRGTTLLTFGDFQFYTKAAYGAFMAPFNGAGKFYTESFTVQPTTFPAQTTYTWSWPSTPCSGICGFLNLSFGDYDGTVPQSPITSQQIKNITTLVSSHNITLSGFAAGYDVIDDIFLTSSPNTTQVFEVEIFLHTPQFSADYVLGSTQIGSFTGSGVTWTVAIDNTASPPDILLMPTNQADVPVAAIDLKGMFSYLMTQSTITGNEYYNGHAIGSEPRQNGGVMVVNSFSVAFN